MRVRFVVAAVVVLSVSGCAGSAKTAAGDTSKLEARIAELEKSNKDLQAQLDEAQSGAPAEPSVASETDAPVVATDPPAADPPASKAGSQGSPVPLGQPGDLGGGWTVQVDAVDFDGAEELAAANQFNTPDPAERYVLVTITTTYAGDVKANLFDVSTQLLAGGAGVSAYCEKASVAPAQYPIGQEMFKGGSASGQLCFPVDPADDNATFLLYASQGFGNDDVFFALA